LRRE
jgi:hypothetical protein